MRTLKFTFLVLGMAAISSLSTIVMGQTITTVAGCGIGDDSLATNAEVIFPFKAAFDHSGNAYVADDGNNRIRKIDAAGVITTFAGTGNFGGAGDGGPATAATFQAIYSIATDKLDNVYVVDAGNNNVRKINTSGIISTIAGTGAATYTGDGVPATIAALNHPSDIAVDTSGNIYIADRYNYRVRKIDATGMISTVAGNGLSGSPVFGGPATGTYVGYPFRIAVDRSGNLFIASYAAWHILKVDHLSGILTNVAGVGTYGFSGDGGPATAAQFSAPCGVAVDTFGNAFFSDIDNGCIRKIDASTGIITAMAGNGTSGYSGDLGPATAAQINSPEGLCFDANNNLYIADLENNRVRMVGQSGIISTFAGQNGLFGEGYPATNAEMSITQNLTTDVAGNIYVADAYNNRIRKIDAGTGLITTVAGAGIGGYVAGFSGDGGPATAANMFYPSAVAVDAGGSLYICDQDNQRIRKVSSSGIISTIAGNGTAAYAGNGTLALSAEVNYPTAITVDAAGNIYFTDNNNQRIRKINTSGIISTVAGTGVAGFYGDGGPATNAKLGYPGGVAVDASGNLYVCDQGNQRVRKIDTTGIITTIAGDGTPAYGGDGGQATDAQLMYPWGLSIDHNGNLFIADAGNQCIRMINSDGVITTIAGNGTAGFSGDGSLATAAMLSGPQSAAADLSGNLYIADGNNHRVRKVSISYLAVSSVKSAPGLSVYPNPAHDQLIVETSLDPSGKNEIILFDVTGKALLTTPVTSSRQTLDISKFAGGVYFVQVVNEKMEGKNVKVVKE